MGSELASQKVSLLWHTWDFVLEEDIKHHHFQIIPWAKSNRKNTSRRDGGDPREISNLLKKQFASSVDLW